MRATREAMQVYDLADWRLSQGFEPQMTRALNAAIRRQEPIVVTGWALRMLDDPEDVYGQSGSIHTMARLGLADERPQVQRLLDRFYWVTPSGTSRCAACSPPTASSAPRSAP